MKKFAVAFLLAAVLYVVGAEISYIKPNNYFANDKHCVDLECANDEWAKIMTNLTNLDEMKACAQAANDDKLKELVDNLITVIEDQHAYYNQARDQTEPKQETYRTGYMFANIVWFRANIIQEYVEKNTHQNVQACFKQPLDELYRHNDNINSCWKKAGDKKCKESNEDTNGSGNSGENDGRDDKGSGSNEDDEDTKICGVQKDVPNANMICVKLQWKMTTYDVTPPVMEKCLGQVSGDTNELKKNIDEYIAAIEYMRKCYQYSDKKNYIELYARLGKVQEAEKKIKNIVSKLPEQNQKCFAPALERAEARFRADDECKFN